MPGLKPTGLVPRSEPALLYALQVPLGGENNSQKIHISAEFAHHSGLK